MKLLKFKVTNFRSVEDSGWIETENVTALIGTNESGKTNLLLPLWKLNPAKDGEINLLSDAPRSHYNQFKNMETKPIFITVWFELPDKLVDQLVEITDVPSNMLRIAEVSRRFDKKYLITFPEYNGTSQISTHDALTLITDAHQKIQQINPSSKDASIQAEIITSLQQCRDYLESKDGIRKHDLHHIQTILKSIDVSSLSKRSLITPQFGDILDHVEEWIALLSMPHPHSHEDARNLVLNHIPRFVYYSNYGNLDSEIYLPHVIENMSRDGLGSREEAKVRTLKVLFEFVKLKPQEILELGKEFPINQRSPTEQEIQDIAEKKKEREVLLQSASTQLTQKFRDWWRQGDYRIRFQADGSHFRIWVSDDKRPEEIELEGRSTGLQWFLSFYLIFLVESLDAHADSILLLDEPGLTLHPLSQKDLSLFFDNLSRSNQLIYTTHSPFMVDPNHLDRVRAVYVDDKGKTIASSDLRAGEKNSAQTKSIYAVHAALGLAVSEALLQGCQPVIVEGFSDQLYLTGIKNYLIRHGKITPKRELIFIPSGGVRGINSTISIVAAKDEQPPFVILDSDAQGNEKAKSLKKDTYKACE